MRRQTGITGQDSLGSVRDAIEEGHPNTSLWFPVCPLGRRSTGSHAHALHPHQHRVLKVNSVHQQIRSPWPANLALRLSCNQMALLSRTPLGRARAWLRLALMQKKMADYLRCLIIQRELLRSVSLGHVHFFFITSICCHPKKK